MARYLLDTNIISYASSGRSRKALERIMANSTEQILVSAISCGELWYGLKRRDVGERLRTATAALLAEATILPWTSETADIYADLRYAMARNGKSLAPLDLLIAAHALEADATLVTNDAAFRHVPGLTVEDWTAP
ncbi:type II toxin-antitoxin system VapC family toxin [Aquibium carbonis]|uniref:Ribonuclease VapC n=1 Tax=Aquibium carbonis TaxID=2495581 RepID=A0A3R9YC73_9HYPH|nr:type II toxin-antitoxin system VapC family toxin [Aquibium carbonis]RST84374.1 type II toxin-antitoxin system VapC family toxin [Aquibium carbonis]